MEQGYDIESLVHAKHIGYEWSHKRNVLQVWLVFGELEKLLWSRLEKL